MKRWLILGLRSFGLALANIVASDLRDYRDGRKIGRALLIPWRGKIYVIGLDPAIRVEFIPQKRLTFWQQEIGFTAHSPPDFPHEPSA